MLTFNLQHLHNELHSRYYDLINIHTTNLRFNTHKSMRLNKKSLYHQHRTAKCAVSVIVVITECLPSVGCTYFMYPLILISNHADCKCRFFCLMKAYDVCYSTEKH